MSGVLFIHRDVWCLDQDEDCIYKNPVAVFGSNNSAILAINLIHKAKILCCCLFTFLSLESSFSKVQDQKLC